MGGSLQNKVLKEQVGGGGGIFGGGFGGGNGGSGGNGPNGDGFGDGGDIYRFKLIGLVASNAEE